MSLQAATAWLSYQNLLDTLCFFLVLNHTLSPTGDILAPIAHCADLQQFTDISLIGMGGDFFQVLLIYYDKYKFFHPKYKLLTNFNITFPENPETPWDSYCIFQKHDRSIANEKTSEFLLISSCLKNARVIWLLNKATIEFHYLNLMINQLRNACHGRQVQ